MTLVYFLIFTIITSGLAFKIVMSGYDTYDYAYAEDNFSTESRINNTADKHADLIKVYSPEINAAIGSPLTIKGEARGNWYFEASFPVHLFDANGKELAVAPATAQGEWMTTNFVPFELTLTFDKPSTATGNLVLEKDNASGLAERDDSISIPVKFK
jgi:hypothetical protein